MDIEIIGGPDRMECGPNGDHLFFIKIAGKQMAILASDPHSAKWNLRTIVRDPSDLVLKFEEMQAERAARFWAQQTKKLDDAYQISREEETAQ